MPRVSRKFSQPLLQEATLGARRELISKHVLKHVHIENGSLRVDFDLEKKEVVLASCGKKIGSSNCHVIIRRTGEIMRVEVLDPTLDEPLSATITDWSGIGQGKLQGMSKENVDDLCSCIMERIVVDRGVPKLTIDMKGQLKPIHVVTQAMSFMGQTFVAKCLRVGPNIIVDATSMKDSKNYRIELREQDWKRSGYGPLDSLTGGGEMGKGRGAAKETKIVELCRMILSGIDLVTETNPDGSTSLKLISDDSALKYLYERGMVIGGRLKRVRIYDADSLGADSPGGAIRDTPNILKIVLDSVGEDSREGEGAAGATLKLDVPVPDWCRGLVGEATRQKLMMRISNESIKGILSDKRFSDMEQEKQSEVVDYLVEHLAIDRSGNLLIDHKGELGKSVILFVENVKIGGVSMATVKVEAESKGMVSVTCRILDGGAVHSVALRSDCVTAVDEFIDKERRSVDSDAVLSGIYWDAESGLEFDLKKKWEDICAMKIAGVGKGWKGKGKVSVSVKASQVGNTLIVEGKEVGGLNKSFSRRVYPSAWRNTGYGALNTLSKEDVQAVAKIVLTSLSRNAYKDRNGFEKQLIDWAASSEDCNEEGGSKQERSLAFFAEISGTAKSKETLLNALTIHRKMSSSMISAAGQRYKKMASVVSSFKSPSTRKR